MKRHSDSQGRNSRCMWRYMPHLPKLVSFFSNFLSDSITRIVLGAIDCKFQGKFYRRMGGHIRTFSHLRSEYRIL